jgi:subtilisin family serine protease
MDPRMDRRRLLKVAACLAVALTFSAQVLAGGGRRREEPEPSKGRSVITLEIEDEWRVELPDQESHPIGSNLRNAVLNHLVDSDIATVFRPNPEIQALSTGFDSSPRRDRGSWVWNGSYTPAADVLLKLRAATFQTGSQGNRSQYGIDERYQDELSTELFNEFPLRGENEPFNWFPHSFRKKGFGPTGSHSGLMLGDGFSLNFFFAFLTVKWASYSARILFDVELFNRFEDQTIRTEVETTGKGFFFDISGGYADYSIGIALARSDAMVQAYDKAAVQAAAAVERSLRGLPLLARVDHVIEDDDGETIALLGTGEDPRIQDGLVYRDTEDLGLALEIIESNDSGAVGRYIAGPIDALRPGLLFVDEEHHPDEQEPEELVAESRSVNRNSKAVRLAASETVKFEDHNLKRLPNETLQTPQESGIGKFLEDTVGFFLLPYRIWRYHRYDRHYSETERDGGDFKTAEAWSQHVAATRLGRLMNLSSDSTSGDGVRVAILDSGVDYRHRTLHRSIWKNPQPFVDSRGRSDEWGFDFYSGDPRAYDDHFHGTGVASQVLALAPAAKLIPVKVFNPWGITSSAALLEGIRFAIDQGAHLIVCAWASEVPSEALLHGLRLAEQAGVLVVTSAGQSGLRLPASKAFPAEWNDGTLENLLVVGALDEKLQRWDRPDGATNYGRSVVDLMAVATGLEVLEPRGGKTRENSVDYAAALVAGLAAARIPREGDPTDARSHLAEWKERVLQETRTSSQLTSAARGGRYLFLRR